MTPNCLLLDIQSETISMDGNTNHQWGGGKGPRRNSRLLKKHPFHSRSKAHRTTFKLYKNSKSQTLQTLVSHELVLIFHLHLSIFFLLLFARKTNIVSLFFIVSQTYFNKKPFLLFVCNEFSLFFELLDNLATHFTWLPEEDPAELCQPPLWIFPTQRWHGRTDKENSRKQMW